jgi:hypothetical protein
MTVPIEHPPVLTFFLRTSLSLSCKVRALVILRVAVCKIWLLYAIAVGAFGPGTGYLNLML